MAEIGRKLDRSRLGDKSNLSILGLALRPRSDRATGTLREHSRQAIAMAPWCSMSESVNFLEVSTWNGLIPPSLW